MWNSVRYIASLKETANGQNYMPTADVCTKAMPSVSTGVVRGEWGYKNSIPRLCLHTLSHSPTAATLRCCRREKLVKSGNNLPVAFFDAGFGSLCICLHSLCVSVCLSVSLCACLCLSLSLCLSRSVSLTPLLPPSHPHPSL